MQGTPSLQYKLLQTTIVQVLGQCPRRMWVAEPCRDGHQPIRQRWLFCLRHTDFRPDAQLSHLHGEAFLTALVDGHVLRRRYHDAAPWVAGNISRRRRDVY
jgi:hypothetical protein